MTLETLKNKGFDSVLAPRGTKSTGGVLNDEYVVYNPDQAIPRYIIHYRTSAAAPAPIRKPAVVENFVKKNVKASRDFNPDDPWGYQYRVAEAQYLRMIQKRQSATAAFTSYRSATLNSVTSIDIVINKALEEKFERKKKEFEAQGIPATEVLAFHGTQNTNTDSILKNNFQMTYAKRQAYGRGIYFSEFPDISQGYGNSLLLCKVLSGKEFVDCSRSDIPDGFNSKKVRPSVQDKCGEMLIIDQMDQILPAFVIHLSGGS